MSELPPHLYGRPDDGRWPFSSALLGMRGTVAPADSLLLERCFGSDAARWSDAMVTRMRRHLGGCVLAAEAALRDRLSHAGEEGRALAAALPDGLSWRALQRRPGLLGRGLVDHFRDRAAISLMAQEELSGIGQEASPAADLFPIDIAADLAVLAQGEQRWADERPDDAPMSLDLPAEELEQLVWTVMALVADTVAPTRSLPVVEMAGLADQAGRAMLADYDEGAAPLVLAALLAHRLRGMGAGEEQLLWLARHRHILALMGVLADRLGIDIALLVSRIVEGPEYLLFHMCRAADFPREVAVRLMLGRRSIARGVEDSVLVEYADGYDRLSREQAARAVAPLGFARSFREKLSVLRNWPAGAAADGR